MMAFMVGDIDKLFVVKRSMAIQVLYYCPRCESINEVVDLQQLDALRCHECACELSATSAYLEAITPPADEQ